ncbi:hypothetical protein B0O99DRAFT_740342 [Bisporella sp. PMI_857]|nr:hypothetical protein B0O99DRAFT_740342 [Bisporella sp. PMI_857]
MLIFHMGTYLRDLKPQFPGHKLELFSVEIGPNLFPPNTSSTNGPLILGEWIERALRHNILWLEVPGTGSGDARLIGAAVGGEIRPPAADLEGEGPSSIVIPYIIAGIMLADGISGEAENPAEFVSLPKAIRAIRAIRGGKSTSTAIV